jgi:membrane peptidoglycan carboxypeptidase
VSRKLRELLYAAEMEQTLGKQRILALYLNTAEWGPGIYGARNAARAYFGKEPAELRLEEAAAWLAGILRNPATAWRDEYATGAPRTDRLA